MVLIKFNVLATLLNKATTIPFNILMFIVIGVVGIGAVTTLASAVTVLAIYIR